MQEVVAVYRQAIVVESMRAASSVPGDSAGSGFRFGVPDRKGWSILSVTNGEKLTRWRRDCGFTTLCAVGCAPLALPSWCSLTGCPSRTRLQIHRTRPRPACTDAAAQVAEVPVKPPDLPRLSDAHRHSSLRPPASLSGHRLHNRLLLRPPASLSGHCLHSRLLLCPSASLDGQRLHSRLRLLTSLSGHRLHISIV